MPPVFILNEEPIQPATTVFKSGEGAEAQFLGVVRGEEDGKPISSHNFKKLLAQHGVQALAQHDKGDPAGRAELSRAHTLTGSRQHVPPSGRVRQCSRRSASGPWTIDGRMSHRP